MEYIEFGKIVNTHGIKGEIKIYPYTNDIDNILKLKKVYIDELEFNVQSIKLHKNMFIIKLVSIDSIEDAQKYMNKLVYRGLEQKEKLDNHEYYVRDLEGINVFLEDGCEFGILKEVFQTGANDVYNVVTKEYGEVLIPAIKSVVKSVDLKGRKMVIHFMEGLI